LLADETILFAAGSLKAALGDVAASYTKETGVTVVTVFAPSGLLRERIEKGEPAHVFASANMSHPRKLADAGKAGEVRLFARNRLCALTQPGLEVETDALLEVMLDPAVTVGTSTPKADPSGDYAIALFDMADAIKPGAAATLKDKSLQLTGGPDSAKPPEGRNPYGWVMSEGKADLFLTYCTNALLAKADVPDLRIVAIPEALAVGADYGLTALNDAPAAAVSLADYILSPVGQATLESYGFTPARK
jgi:ABC-type molybdate transport system substrate-binding protein